MEFKTEDWLLMAARVVAIAAIAFISMFSFDAFGGDAPLVEQFVGWIIHMLPSFALIVALWASWNHPATGALAFLVTATLPFWLLPNESGVNFILSAPFAVTGALFALVWWMRFSAKR